MQLILGPYVTTNHEATIILNNAEFPISTWILTNISKVISLLLFHGKYGTKHKKSELAEKEKPLLQKKKLTFRRNQWNRHADGSKTFGYQCYNQINNGSKSKRESMGLDSTGYCDIKMIAAWKLDYMAKLIFEHLWKDRKESILIALDLIKKYYKDERSLTDNSVQKIQRELEKAEQNCEPSDFKIIIKVQQLRLFYRPNDRHKEKWELIV